MFQRRAGTEWICPGTAPDKLGEPAIWFQFQRSADRNVGAAARWPRGGRRRWTCPNRPAHLVGVAAVRAGTNPRRDDFAAGGLSSGRGEPAVFEWRVPAQSKSPPSWSEHFLENAMISHAPTLRGVIDRRMLVNFRVRPDVVARLLPLPFRPKLVRGWAMAGICLIRLKDVRPRGLPAALGLSSENAAHRIAVEWNDGAAAREGVFIPRRDTSSKWQAFVAGRVFAGVHHQANFDVRETADLFSLEMRSLDGSGSVKLKAQRASSLNSTSIFTSLAEASEFFARGSVGYSATTKAGCWDGLELHTTNWNVEPLAVSEVRSSFFDDAAKFPARSIEFDCALLMRGIEHEWRTLPQLRQAKDRL